jgi:type II secretory pathway pseudopilin PulG
MPARIRIFWRAAGIGLVAFLIAFAAWVCSAAHSAREAERTLHAERVVFLVLERYARDNPQGWPKSWEELSSVQLPPAEQSPIFNWPKNLDEFRKRVDVNFGLSRGDVEAMHADTFSAIRPIGPYYELSYEEIGAFLQELRKLRSQKPEPGRKG